MRSSSIFINNHSLLSALPCPVEAPGRTAGEAAVLGIAVKAGSIVIILTVMIRLLFARIILNVFMMGTSTRIPARQRAVLEAGHGDLQEAMPRAVMAEFRAGVTRFKATFAVGMMQESITLPVVKQFRMGIIIVMTTVLPVAMMRMIVHSVLQRMLIAITLAQLIT